MRVSALRITHDRLPPSPVLWEGFEDVIYATTRHGRLWTDTSGIVPLRHYSSEPYNRRADEQWLDQQNAKNKARALAQYEWKKPEAAAARIAKAKADWIAQKAAREEHDRVLREQVSEAEAERERQAKANRLAKDEAIHAARLRREAANAAVREQAEAERAAAIAWWTSINPTYHGEQYRPCRFAEIVHFGAVTLEADRGYWLPLSVRGAILRGLGYG